jgi:hypothetical protein
MISPAGRKERVMMKSDFAKMICATFITCMCAAAFGQTVTTLQVFNGPNGDYPSGPLIQGADGNLYGTTGAEGPTAWVQSSK